MVILNRYLGRIILQYSLVSMAALLALFTFVNFLDQVGDLGKGDYGLLDAITYVVLTIPRLLYELFPMAALLGTIIGLSLLANDSELIVMRASGVSMLQITTAALKMGGLFIIFAVVVGEVISPYAETRAERGRAEAMHQNIQQQTNFGLWMRDTQTYVNVGEVLPGARDLDRIHDQSALCEASKARHFVAFVEPRIDCGCIGSFAGGCTANGGYGVCFGSRRCLRAFVQQDQHGATLGTCIAKMPPGFSRIVEANDGRPPSLAHELLHRRQCPAQSLEVKGLAYVVIGQGPQRKRYLGDNTESAFTAEKPLAQIGSGRSARGAAGVQDLTVGEHHFEV